MVGELATAVAAFETVASLCPRNALCVRAHMSVGGAHFTSAHPCSRIQAGATHDWCVHRERTQVHTGTRSTHQTYDLPESARGLRQQNKNHYMHRLLLLRPCSPAPQRLCDHPILPTPGQDRSGQMICTATLTRNSPSHRQASKTPGLETSPEQCCSDVKRSREKFRFGFGREDGCKLF